MDWTKGRFSWQARVHLPALAHVAPANGVTLVFAPEGRGLAPLSEEERALAEWVPAHHADQARTVQKAVLAEYKDACSWVADVQGASLPVISGPEALGQVVTLKKIFVHQVSRDGRPYVGYQFECAWDGEHGLGVLMHGQRIVERGGADCAFLLWMAEEDAASVDR
ncbi:DUF6985 domain-containing protein [Mesobacterium pallidum]|uniref:DUF6985 domain-containing protein n=1 Tax=Mesobacterium pallidum TaxID=2872037 RepID=UPI001EE38609|nr:hypothetical protein [Mesobacterium pallidum]